MPYADREEKRAYQREWMRRRRQEWIAQQGGACVQCGSTRNLEVDHVDPAQKAMNPAAIWSRTRAAREIELAKCQVLCRDCHDIKSGRTSAPHGSATRYQKHKCRCAACRAWNKARVRRNRAASL